MLEESPSPAIDDELRTAMSVAAVAFARAIAYRSAGTVEFMFDGKDFWLLELNGRIQVEHPVTELVMDVDLVEQQLRVATGVELTPPGLPAGHAVEVRLYAEDPRTFLPQAGRIERLRLPAGVRVDSGAEEGDVIGTSYDPLIAKLIAHAATRDDAFDTLADALGNTDIAGVTTNLPFLRWLVSHPYVRSGRATTAFLTEHPPSAHRSRVAATRGAGRGGLTSWPPPAPARRRRGRTRFRHIGHGKHAQAQMPGTVIRLLVAEATRVGAAAVARPRGKKMERLLSPHDATVHRLHVAEGDQITAGTLLVRSRSSYFSDSIRTRCNGLAGFEQPADDDVHEPDHVVAPTYVQKPSIEKSGQSTLRARAWRR